MTAILMLLIAAQNAFNLYPIPNVGADELETMFCIIVLSLRGLLLAIKISQRLRSNSVRRGHKKVDAPTPPPS